jgi:hypothetical protein
LKPAKSANELVPDPYSSTWADLIGPEYAAVLRPYRKLILVGGAGAFVGLAAGLVWMSRAGNIPGWADFLGAWTFFFPGFATFTIGLVLQARLSYKINRDLWAAKLRTPSRSPDLRNKSRFLYWSRHFGVTPEQVQEAGRRAAAAPSGARGPSAPNDQGLWDLNSKNRGDTGRGDAE